MPPVRRPRPSTWCSLLTPLALLAAAAGAVPLPCEPQGRSAPELRFRHLGIEDGLAQNSVMALLQDRRGFLWIGTQGGLHRYDGYHFEVWRPDPYDAQSISHGHVQALLEGTEGSLWVGTFRGLDRFDPLSERFEHIPLGARGERPPHILSLAADERGGLWIGTLGQGLWYRGANGATRRLRHRPGDPTSLPGDAVWAVAVDGSGDLWTASAPGGVARLAGDPLEAGVLSFARPHTATGGVGSPAHALWRDTEGRIWAGTEDGLLRHDPTNDRLEPVTTPADVRSIAVGDREPDERQVLWLATADRGLLRVALGSDQRVSYRHHSGDRGSLGDDALRALLVDRTGLLWVGTAFAGLDVTDPDRELRHVRSRPDAGGLPHGVVRAFARDDSGNLWIGTDGGGLILCAQGGDGFASFRHLADDLSTLADDRVWSLHVDPAGTLWVGTQGGLHRRRADGGFDRWQHDPTVATSLAPGGVRALADAGGGRLWVAHFGGGLDLFDPSTGASEHRRRNPADPRSLSSDLLLALEPGPQGQLWVGGADGLDLLVPGSGVVARFHHRRGDPQSLAGDLVRALHLAADGALWIGTDAGLSRLAADPAAGGRAEHGAAGRRFSHLRQADGLPDATVYAIVEDLAGHLWLSTNRGLARYAPSDGEVVGYGLSQGVQALEFNGAAALADGEGNLYFGGVDGFNVFRPAELVTHRRESPVVLTAVEVPGRVSVAGGRREQQGAAIVLDHDERTLALEFAALDFSDRGSRRYAYRLSGLSDRWVELGERHDLVLTGLEPGSYRLEVRGADERGVWSRPGAILDLEVLPPPWRTSWAYLLYASGLVAGVGLVTSLAVRRRRIERRMNDEIRTREERLDMALRGSGDALWDWDLRRDELYRAHLAEMLGYRPEELPPGLELHELLAHPDDRGRAVAAVRQHLEGGTSRYECEYRLRAKNGEWRWIHDRGLVVERDADGRPLRIAGTVKDITRPKQVESELRLWATVFDNALEGVVIIDARGTIQAVNDAFCQISGRPRESLVGSPVAGLRSPVNGPAFYRAVRRALASEGHWRGEVHHQRPDGASVVAWVSLTRVRDDRGRPSHDVGVVSDITRRKKNEEELRYLASFDALTDLPNRASFREQLEAAIAEAGRDALSLALIFGDLDGLKEVNDAHGHPVGDALLGEAARRLEASVRRGDLVARQSGDEFTVLLRDLPAGGPAGYRQAEAVAQRIIAAFDRPFDLDGLAIAATISLGVALYPADGGDAEALLRRADEAMYRAKTTGRDRYCFFGGQPLAASDAVSGSAPRLDVEPSAAVLEAIAERTEEVGDQEGAEDPEQQKAPVEDRLVGSAGE